MRKNSLPETMKESDPNKSKKKKNQVIKNMLTIRMYRFDFKTSAQIVFIGFLHTSFDFLRQHRHLNLKQVLIIILNRCVRGRLRGFIIFESWYCRCKNPLKEHQPLETHRKSIGK